MALDLRNDADRYTDLTVRIEPEVDDHNGGVQVRAHRVVLAAASERFRREIDELGEGAALVLRVPADYVDAARVLLRSLYAQPRAFFEEHCPQELVVRVIQLASTFEAHRLADLAAQHLASLAEELSWHSLLIVMELLGSPRALLEGCCCGAQQPCLLHAVLRKLEGSGGRPLPPARPRPAPRRSRPYTCCWATWARR
jgi:hypothetical protein